MEGRNIVVGIMLLVGSDSVKVHPGASQGQEGGWLQLMGQWIWL